MECDGFRFFFFTFSDRTLPGEMKEILVFGFFLDVFRLMRGILPVQLNASRVLRSDFFLTGLSKESGTDCLTDGPFESMGGAVSPSASAC